MGYHRAGFDVVGIDINPQPHYPFAFVQGNCCAPPMDFRHFDIIHASPPCQAKLHGLGAVNRTLGREYLHKDLLPEIRALLQESKRPYVIEQPLQGARLNAPIVLCGSSFGLAVRRHRQFEITSLVLAPPCEHDRQREKRFWTGYAGVSNGSGGRHFGRDVERRSAVVQVYGCGSGGKDQWGPAMGIDWMNHAELSQAIPPAYTEWIGQQLLGTLALAYPKRV